MPPSLSGSESQVLETFSVAIADGFVPRADLALIYEKGKGVGLDQVRIDALIKNPESVEFHRPADLVDVITRLYDLACVVISEGVIPNGEVNLVEIFHATL